MIKEDGVLFSCYSGIGYLYFCGEDGTFSCHEQTINGTVHGGYKAEAGEGAVRDGCYSRGPKFGFSEEGRQLHGYVPVHTRSQQEKARSESRHRV